MTEIEWTQQFTGPEKEGREAVEQSPELRFMRAAAAKVIAHAETFREKIEKIQNDKDLTEAGRERQLEAVRKERDERLQKIIDSEFNRAKNSLLDRYANADPMEVRLPVQGSDAQRAVWFARKLEMLSPERAIEEFQKLLRSTTNEARILVQELTPIIRDWSETKPAWREALPMDVVNDTLRGARLMMTSKDNLSADYLRTNVAPQIERELNRILDDIRYNDSFDPDRVEILRAGGQREPTLMWLASESEGS